jgi:hypothetical protein
MGQQNVRFSDYSYGRYYDGNGSPIAVGEQPITKKRKRGEWDVEKHRMKKQEYNKRLKRAREFHHCHFTGALRLHSIVLIIEVLKTHTLPEIAKPIKWLILHGCYQKTLTSHIFHFKGCQKGMRHNMLSCHCKDKTTLTRLCTKCQHVIFSSGVCLRCELKKVKDQRLYFDF